MIFKGLKTGLTAIAFGCALTATGLAAAADYPTRPITMVVGYPAGQAVDILARMVGEGISRELGQPVVIDNRIGAGGTVGTVYVKRAASDGYTISMSASGPLAIAPQLFKGSGYDPRTDFTPIMTVASMANVMVVRSNSKYNNVADLVAAAKANPGKINFGSPGNGSTSHLTQEMFKQSLGIKMEHVPYKGSTAALTDLVGGQIDVLLEASASIRPFLEKGDIRAIAVTSAKPVPDLPKVDPIGKTIKGFEAIGWMGVIGPAGMDAAIVNKLNAAMVKTLKDPTMRTKLQDLGLQPVGDTPAQFKSFISSEYKKWGDTIRDANVTVQ